MTNPYLIDDAAWLLWGRAIRGENKITFHPSVQAAQIIRLERPVYWYRDTEQEQVLISRKDDPWADREEFAYVKSSTVRSNRVTDIPMEFFHNFDRYGSEEMNREKRVDEPYRLEYNHLYYPVAPDRCFAEDDAAYLLPVEDVVTIWDAKTAQKRTEEDIRDYGIDLPDEGTDRGGEPA